MSLSLVEEGFKLDGLEMGDATGEEGLAGDFSVVVTDGEPTGLDENPNDDFGRASLGHWVACLLRTNLTRSWSA